jgi:hypothetical protein
VGGGLAEEGDALGNQANASAAPPHDILTGGRVIFGVGRGYHTREVETLGAAPRSRSSSQTSTGLQRR